MFHWRALAIYWWKHHAESAWFAAYALWRLDSVETLRETVFDDDAVRVRVENTTLSEAWHREAALALELIIKAVIVSNSQDEKPEAVFKKFSHDLPKLWRDAQLPPLAMRDMHSLESMRELLEWSGRYPTPRTAEALERSRKRVRSADTRPRPTKGLKGMTPLLYRWGDVARLYDLALAAIPCEP